MPTAMTYASLQQNIQLYLERGSSAAQDPTVYSQIPFFIGLAERRIARELKIQGLQDTVVTTLQPALNVYAKPDRWRETISMNVGNGAGQVQGLTLLTDGADYISAPTVTITGGGGTGATGRAFVRAGNVVQVSLETPGSGYTTAPTVTITGGGGAGATASATISLTYDIREPVKPLSYEGLRRYWPNDSAVDLPLYYADYDAQHWIFAPTPDAARPIEILYWQLPPLLDDNNTTNWLTQYAPMLLLYGSLLEAEPFLKNDARIETWGKMYDRAMGAFNGEDVRKIVDRTMVRQE